MFLYFFSCFVVSQIVICYIYYIFKPSSSIFSNLPSCCIHTLAPFFSTKKTQTHQLLCLSFSLFIAKRKKKKLVIFHQLGLRAGTRGSWAPCSHQMFRVGWSVNNIALSGLSEPSLREEQHWPTVTESHSGTETNNIDPHLL